MPTGLNQLSGDTKSDRKLYTKLKKQFSFRLDRGLMKQVMFQMNLDDCGLSVALTPCVEETHELELETTELAVYKCLENKISKHAQLDAEKEYSVSHMMLLSYIVYLRQAANSLYLVRSQLSNDPNYSEALLPGRKTHKCMELVLEVPQTDKVIVFSEFLGMMQVLGKELQKQDIPHLYYVGGMTIQERSACIEEFRKHEGKIILIAMKQCISVGLNLTDANHVIFFSQWWNFTLDRQCVARIHRIGQKKPVFVHKLMAMSTIDSRIQEIAAKKEQEIKNASNATPNKHMDKYLKQSALTDYGFLLNLSP